MSDGPRRGPLGAPDLVRLAAERLAGQAILEDEARRFDDLARRLEAGGPPPTVRTRDGRTVTVPEMLDRGDVAAATEEDRLRLAELLLRALVWR